MLNIIHRLHVAWCPLLSRGVSYLRRSERVKQLIYNYQKYKYSAFYLEKVTLDTNTEDRELLSNQWINISYSHRCVCPVQLLWFHYEALKADHVCVFVFCRFHTQVFLTRSSFLGCWLMLLCRRRN